MTYTIGQIQEFHDYLEFCVKKGYIEEDDAQDIEERQDWKKVDDLMGDGDFLANAKD